MRHVELGEIQDGLQVQRVNEDERRGGVDGLVDADTTTGNRAEQVGGAFLDVRRVLNEPSGGVLVGLVGVGLGHRAPIGLDGLGLVEVKNLAVEVITARPWLGGLLDFFPRGLLGWDVGLICRPLSNTRLGLPAESLNAARAEGGILD